MHSTNRQKSKNSTFHLYLYQPNEESVASAKELRQKVIDLNQAGFFTVFVGGFHTKPVGPHISGLFLWCPKEHFLICICFLWSTTATTRLWYIHRPLRKPRPYRESRMVGQPLPLIVIHGFRRHCFIHLWKTLNWNWDTEHANKPNDQILNCAFFYHRLLLIFWFFKNPIFKWNFKLLWFDYQRYIEDK